MLNDSRQMCVTCEAWVKDDPSGCYRATLKPDHRPGEYDSATFDVLVPAAWSLVVGTKYLLHLHDMPAPPPAKK